MFLRGRGKNELQLELGNLFSAFAGRHPYLPAAVAVWHRLDTGNIPARLGDRALRRRSCRSDPYLTPAVVGAGRQCLCRTVSQNFAAGANVPLVFRAAGTDAAGYRRLA